MDLKPRPSSIDKSTGKPDQRRGDNKKLQVTLRYYRANLQPNNAT